MALTSKQRAYLRGLSAAIDPIFQIGKSSLTPEMVAAVDEALEAREMVKINVLKNCMDDEHMLADTLAGRTRSEVVHVIGRKIVLYRPCKRPEKRRIELPR